MDVKDQFYGDLIFQIEFRETRSAKFYWQFRTPDGYVGAKASHLFSDLDLCVANACEEGVRAFTQVVSGNPHDRQTN